MAAIAGSFELSSPDFLHNTSMPSWGGCQSLGNPPRLSWSGAPPQTQSYLLTVIDYDAPLGFFVHWIVYNIPSTEHQLGRGDSLSKMGINSRGSSAFSPFCPPYGTHHYTFTLYALDTTILFSSSPTYEALQKAIASHILKTATLVGKFSLEK